MINTIFWSYLFGLFYFIFYFIIWQPGRAQLEANLAALANIPYYLGIIYFLSLLLLFKDATLTWCNKHSQVSKVSFYSSLQPVCMAIFFKFFCPSSSIHWIHLISSLFALAGYILIFTE